MFALPMQVDLGFYDENWKCHKVAIMCRLINGNKKQCCLFTCLFLKDVTNDIFYSLKEALSSQRAKYCIFVTWRLIMGKKDCGAGKGCSHQILDYSNI